MNTAELTTAIMQAATEAGARLFRNNSGVAVHRRDGRTYRTAYGVGPTGGGGGDLIGWSSDGRFVSIEIKVGKDRQTEAQKKWMRWVIAGGGLAGEARSVDDALKIIKGGF